MATSAFPFPCYEDIPLEHRVEVPYLQPEYLINGEIRRWSGPMQQVLSPVCLQRNGKIEQVVLGEYPLLTKQEALDALQSAQNAFRDGLGSWPAMSYRERVARLERFVVKMNEKRTEVVRLLMWEIGKTYADAAKEFDRTVQYMRETFEALHELRNRSEEQVIREGVRARTLRAPLGIVLCMGPFNYPLNETFTTLIPALAMGNVVIFKLPKLGVLLFKPLLEAFRDSFPPGVVNMLYGDGRELVGPLMASGKIDLLAFIGSTGVANALLKQHPHAFRLRSILGMGAKNPAIILPDANIALTVKECVAGALSFNGQRCTALKLLFVHNKIADRFLSALGSAVDGLKRGMPWDDGVQLTPLPEPGKPAVMTAYLEDAVKNGSRVVNSLGGIVESTFFHPAVIYPVKPGMRLYAEEQFGPLIPIVPFSDISEPMGYVANSPYAQQASIFTTDPLELSGLSRRLQRILCRVNINSQCQRGPDLLPFTGRRESALGTLSIADALTAFSIESVVAGKESPENAPTLSAALA